MILRLCCRQFGVGFFSKDLRKDAWLKVIVDTVVGCLPLPVADPKSKISSGSPICYKLSLNSEFSNTKEYL